MSVYLVDTNFFIQAHRAIYPLDVVKSFWIKVAELANERSIISIDKVKDEIYQNDDELKQWCQQYLPAYFFKDSTIAINEYRQIARWTQTPNTHYSTNAIQEFLAARTADSWLVAYAMRENIKLITYEKSAPLSKKRIKIPDVCISFSVVYLNTIEMFRELNEHF